MKTALSRTLLGIFLIGFSQITKADTTILLTDNFNAGGMGDFSSFNNANASTQTGILSPMNYHVSYPINEAWRLQHSNNGQLLSLPGSSASSVADFGIAANAENSPLRVSFTIDVGNWNNSTDPLQWAHFSIAKLPKQDPLSSNVFFSALFRLNGSTSLIGASGGSGPNWTANDMVTILFSDSSGTGSAFSGHGSRVSFTIGGVTVDYSMNPMDAGYITFGGYSYGSDGGIAKVDNLSVSLTVPEPSALSLLAVGLGGLAILRRRRS